MPFKDLISPCKINLSLRVNKKLTNGLHQIQSLVTFCHVYDKIKVKEIKTDRDEIKFKGRFSKNIKIKNNTISKTLLVLRTNGFLKKKYFKVIIKKNIPHGAGLGSGSGNAAALLNFFVKKKYIKIKKNKLISLCRLIGFDVPLFLNLKNLYIHKNKTFFVKKKFNFYIVVVFPGLRIFTKEIYKSNLNRSKSPNYRKSLFLERKTILDVLISEKNDLQTTVFKKYKKIKLLNNFIHQQDGCFLSRMSGSGSSCYGLFLRKDKAIKAKRNIKYKFPKYWAQISKTI